LSLKFTENELQTSLTATDGSRAITHPSTMKKAWKNLSQSDGNCVLALDIFLIRSDYRSKLNLHIILKFGCLHATYSLSVKYLKHDPH